MKPENGGFDPDASGLSHRSRQDAQPLLVRGKVCFQKIIPVTRLNNCALQKTIFDYFFKFPFWNKETYESRNHSVSTGF